MAINKKLIHFKLKSSFETELANNNILDTSIVFIQETKEIWTHGQLYKCSDPDLSNYVKESELQELLSPIQSSLANKLEVSDLAGYAKTSDIPAVVTDSTVSNWGFIKTSDANETYAPKSLVETVSNQSTTISTLATKNELSTGLAGKLDNSAASGFVPTTRTINGTALTDNIWITATDPNAATKEELNGLATTVANKAEVSALANFATTDALSNGLSGKQETLVSGTNIKTIEGQSILGSGDIQITAAEVGAYTTGQVDEKVTALNNAISGKVDPSTVTAVSDRVSTLEGYFSTVEDSDATINKWGEIVNFLDGVAEGSNVEQLLAAKANQSALNDLSTTVSNVDAKFANYLPLSGGTISSDYANLLTLKIKNGKATYLTFAQGGEDKAYVGYNTDLGTFLQGPSGSLILTPSGATLYNNTLIHSGNIVESVDDLNDTTMWRFFRATYKSANLPMDTSNYLSGISFAVDGAMGYRHQLGGDYHGRLFYRHMKAEVWQDWKTIAFTDSDITGTANNAKQLGGYDASVYPTFENQGTCIGFNLYADYKALGQGDGHIEFYDGGWYNSMWGKVIAVDGFVGNLSGNATSATKLQTARTIWGQSFDGTGNVTSPAIMRYLLFSDSDGGESGFVGRGDNEDALFFRSYKNAPIYIGRNGYNDVLIKDGNVGIGTTNPQYKLHVDGDGYFSGQLNVSNINGYTPITSGNIGSQTVSHALTATDARYVVADNNAALPQYALLQSGNRADDSTGDTWIYYDSLGGADAPWGIKHNQLDNYIEFYGAGAPKSFINLSTGNHYAKGFVNTDYWSAEYALTSNGGVAHIPSMSVAYATTAGHATSSGNADNLGGVSSGGYYRANFGLVNDSTNLMTLGPGCMTLGGSTGGESYAPINYGSLVTFGTTYYTPQLCVEHDATRAWLRGIYNTSEPSVSPWHQIAFTDSNVASASALLTATYKYAFVNGNNVLFGFETAQNSYDTILAGRNISLRYGTTPTTGLILNSSGNVTIGDSDLAGTNYKLYVKGSFNATSGYINGNEIITSANIGSQSVNYANSAGSATDQTARDAAATAQSTANGKWTWSANDVANVKVNNAGYADSAGFAGNAGTLAGVSLSNGSNIPWGTIPMITEGGWMDVGKSFEFHYDNTTGSDYSTNLTCTGNYGNNVNLPSASGTLALTTDNVASATNAYNDGNGNNIVNTYATKSEIPSIPTSLPANGGNADTLDNKHAVDFLQCITQNGTFSSVENISTDLTPGLHKIHIGGTEYSSILAGEDFSGSYWQMYFHPSSGYSQDIKYRATNCNWKTLLDSNNYTTYCTPANIGAAPASHTHSTSQITDFPSSLPANGGTATNAYNDQNGSNIVNTYATKDWVSSNFNYSTDSWRPITDSYSGSEQGTSLSQYGANALYNALVNGYAAEAGYASSAGSANSVAWSNVSGRPTSVSQFTNDSGYATQSWVSSNFNYSTDTWRPVYDGVDSSATDTSASANAVRLAYGRADEAYNLAAGKQDAISDLSTIRSQASNGNTAYSWGNHASAGYFNASNVWNNPETVTLGTAFGPTEMYNSIQGFINNGTVVVKNGTLYVMDNPSTPVSTHWLDVYSDPQSYGGVFYEGQITLDLYPDRFYDLTHNPLISGLKINSISGWDNIGVISHNIVRFKPTKGTFTLTLPSGIYWANGNSIECEDSSAIYEISFIKRSGGDEITATWTKFTQA